MALRPSKQKNIEITTFDPALLSVRENEFLKEVLGKPTIVAMRECPRDVNPKAIRPILDRVNELEQLRATDGSSWAGIDALKERIDIFLRENEKWARDRARSRRAPRYPSLFSFDSKGRANLGGIGSDSGRVRTYFDVKGNRQKFEIELIPENVIEWVPPTFQEVDNAPAGKALIVNDDLNRIECPVCGRAESYKAASRASYNAARARMSKHLRAAKDSVEEHREVHQQEFS